jgi:8-oxo-dGTP pyrophosphatase MutT (NUDIX family)
VELDDELLDLVDSTDSVYGYRMRSEIYRKGLTNFRVVNAFLRNSRGEIWIPRRTRFKKMFPSCLDMSVGGHVKSGESYEDAIEREAWEETRLDIKSVPVRLLGRLTPHEHGVSAFMQVYEISSDVTPEFNRDDFTEFFWLTPIEALARIAGGDQAKDDLAKLLEIFFLERFRK